MDDVTTDGMDGEKKKLGSRLREFMAEFPDLTLGQLARMSGISHSTLSKMQTGQHAWSTKQIWDGLQRATGVSLAIVEGYFQHGSVSVKEFAALATPKLTAELHPALDLQKLIQNVASRLREQGEDPDFVAAAATSARLILRQIGDALPSEQEVIASMDVWVSEYRALLSRQSVALKSGRYATKRKPR